MAESKTTTYTLTVTFKVKKGFADLGDGANKALLSDLMLGVGGPSDYISIYELDPEIEVVSVE